MWSSSTRVLWQPLIEDNENREEVDKAINKMRGVHKALESAGCGQKNRQKCGLRTKKRSTRVWVAHKAVDYGVAPECRFGQEAYTKKAVDLVKNKSKKI